MFWVNHIQIQNLVSTHDWTDVFIPAYLTSWTSSSFWGREGRLNQISSIGFWIIGSKVRFLGSFLKNSSHSNHVRAPVNDGSAPILELGDLKKYKNGCTSHQWKLCRTKEPTQLPVIRNTSWISCKSKKQALVNPKEIKKHILVTQCIFNNLVTFTYNFRCAKSLISDFCTNLK